MPIHGEDLPKKVRDKLGLNVKGRGSKMSRAGVGHSEPCAGRCACGEQFVSYSKFERHAKLEGAGHHRWSIDLDGPRDPASS